MSSVFYSGLATFGKIRTLVSAIIITIICIGLIIYGFIHMSDKKKLTNATYARITSIQCNEKNMCNMEVSYTLDGHTYTNKFSQQNPQITASQIRIMFDPANPAHSEVELMSSNTEWVIIGVSAVVICIAWLAFYLSVKYKLFAAIEGGVGIARFL
jgi:hypothetical protein